MADGPAYTSVKQHGPLSFTQEILLRPDICEAWDVNEDASVWTFHMRKGMKWSDGAPLTTADVNWYWDNVVNNEEVTLVTPSRWSTEQAGKRTLAQADANADLPRRGVYFFFEPGEERTTSGSGLRVVRAGTHALKPGSKGTLWNRLSTHRGTLRRLTPYGSRPHRHVNG